MVFSSGKNSSYFKKEKKYHRVKSGGKVRIFVCLLFFFLFCQAYFFLKPYDELSDVRDRTSESSS